MLHCIMSVDNMKNQVLFSWKEFLTDIALYVTRDIWSVEFWNKFGGKLSGSYGHLSTFRAVFFPKFLINRYGFLWLSLVKVINNLWFVYISGCCFVTYYIIFISSYIWLLMLLFLCLMVNISLFIESAHWADSIIESRCPYVCLSVCVSVPLPCDFF